MKLMITGMLLIGGVAVFAGCGGDATEERTIASVTVPDVNGLIVGKAVGKLQESDFNVTTHFRYDTTPDGTVINQLPRPGTTARAGDAVQITASKGRKPAPNAPRKPRPKPEPTPEPVNTEDQACGPYSGVDANACHNAYQYACVYGKVEQKVRDYYGGNAPDLATQAQQWALDYYTRQGSWRAGVAGCLAALMDEYQRLYG